jgi:nitroimidazol reductase NimA-like FMN-containing flavoprotein (pyridoxamine 5'-phosphate oxidase superfamily)
MCDDDAMDLLLRGEYGVLSTLSPDGLPYGIPLNYCFIGNSLYFHSAMEGRKIDNITSDKRVSFCVVGGTEVLPAKFSTKYESVIVSGLAEEVFDLEKKRALKGFVTKYSSQYIEKGEKYLDSDTHKTRVFKIIINEMSGKARK